MIPSFKKFTFFSFFGCYHITYHDVPKENNNDPDHISIYKVNNENLRKNQLISV